MLRTLQRKSPKRLVVKKAQKSRLRSCPEKKLSGHFEPLFSDPVNPVKTSKRPRGQWDLQQSQEVLFE